MNVKFEVNLSKKHALPPLRSSTVTLLTNRESSSMVSTRTSNSCVSSFVDNRNLFKNYAYFPDFPWDFSLLRDHWQSPIDVVTENAEYLHLKPLKFTALNDEIIKSIIKNSGHGVSVQLKTKSELFCHLLPHLSGSFLKDNYIFENIHYHWGKENHFGSEHFINGESFALESHIVTYKKSYGDINNALNYKDGVAVLTFFAKEGERNKKFDNFLQYIPKIINGNSSVKVATLDVILWFLPELINCNRCSDYFAYPGSLTTPPFTESVTYIIIPEPLTVSQEQLDILRRLKNDKTEPVNTNRRQIQPLQNRPLISATIIKWNIKINRRNREPKLSSVKRIKD